MAANKGEFLLDDSQLRKLFYDGSMKKIKLFLDDIDPQVLGEKLSKPVTFNGKKSVFGYTPLHELVGSGKLDVKYLLQLAGNANVNCRATSGYTPLHLAASSGNVELVRELLAHGADVNCLDEYGKTPKQTAELSSKSSASVVKLLHSEGGP